MNAAGLGAQLNMPAKNLQNSCRGAAHFVGWQGLSASIIPKPGITGETPMRMLAQVLTCAVIALFAGVSVGRVDAQDNPSNKPKPDLANVKYGPHERNVLDLWKAKSEMPTPLVVYIHGGGFHAGSKETLDARLLSACLANGMSVMAINYRLSPEAKFPDHYRDSARAIQFARHNAKDWNIDGARVAATGGSAGAGTSLWIGFHDDLADPKNEDPVLRQSTRLSSMAVMGAQSTYDPRKIKEWVGGRAHEHPALLGFFGLKADELDTAEAHKRFEAAAPINLLTRDDPPVLAFYNEPRGPLPADAKPGDGIHHINFGLRLKERMDELRIPCTIRHQDERPNVVQETVTFFKQHFKL
jgi:acetyl esterase/lipase